MAKDKEKEKCPECGKKFVNLGSHMKTHENEVEEKYHYFPSKDKSVKAPNREEALKKIDN